VNDQQHPHLGPNEVCACATCLTRHRATVSRLSRRLKRVMAEPDEALTVEDVQRQLRLAGLLFVLSHVAELRNIDRDVYDTFVGQRRMSEVLGDLDWLEKN
jgi:hypothetical protein